jgi:hypothetical protein
MSARSLAVAAVFAWSLPCAVAQQGHPLVGTWSGDWGPSVDERHRVLLVLDYDGEQVTGVINPGRASIVLTGAMLDPATWTVRLEAAASERTEGIGYVIEGRIANLGSIAARTLAGTWVQGQQRGDFRLVMN